MALNNIVKGDIPKPEPISIPTPVSVPTPRPGLKDLDIETEMVKQYQRLVEIQDLILHDFEIPVNQKSQLSNACVSSLESLLKLREKYINMERMQRIEKALIDILNGFPEEMVAPFFYVYEGILEDIE